MLKVFAISILLGLLPVSAGIARPQTSTLPNQDSVRAAEVEVGGASLRQVIEQLAHALNQPIGWVVASDDVKPCQVEKMKLTVASSGGTLRAIEAQCPRYSWVQDALGILVQPTEPKISILDLPIRDFSLTKVKAFDAEGAVWDLPEVGRWLQTNGLLQLKLEEGNKWRGTKTTFSIDLHNVPLREILNEVAVKSGRMTWTIQWFDHDTYLGIYL